MKNEWLFNDPIVEAKKNAAKKLASISLFEYEILTSKLFDDFFKRLMIYKSIIVEVKNEWLFNDPIVEAKKNAAKKLASISLFEYEILTSKLLDDFFRHLMIS